MAAVWALWISVSREQQTRRVTIFAKVIVPDQEMEAGLLLHDGGGEEYVWNSGDPHECLWHSVVEL